MDSRGALKAIAAAVEDGRVVFTYHAEMESLPARGLTVEDVEHALAHASDAEPQSDDGVKWKAYGPLTNGDIYAVVVLLIGRVVVVTAHPPP